METVKSVLFHQETKIIKFAEENEVEFNLPDAEDSTKRNIAGKDFRWNMVDMEVMDYDTSETGVEIDFVPGKYIFSDTMGPVINPDWSE